MCQYARFSAGWGFINLYRFDADNVMRSEGASYLRRCYVNKRLMFVYYFRDDGRELGYYSSDMETVQIHHTPRQWGQSQSMLLDYRVYL